jgi:hypothetical protein
MNTFAALDNSAGFQVAFLFSIGGLILTLALLSIYPDALAVLGTC